MIESEGINLDIGLICNCVSVLPLFIGVHADAKKSLKRLAFTQKSEINLLLTNKGDINSIFLLYKKIGLILTNMFWELL